MNELTPTQRVEHNRHWTTFEDGFHSLEKNANGDWVKYETAIQLATELEAAQNENESTRDDIRVSLVTNFEEQIRDLRQQLAELKLDKERFLALSKLIWETRWMDDLCVAQTAEDKNMFEAYQKLVGTAAEINSGNFTAIDAALKEQ